MDSREWLVRSLSVFAVAACGLCAQAGEDTSTYVKLKESQKQDAFYTGTWWSDGKIPHADANYSNAGKGLRTTSAERAAAPDDSSYRKNQFRGNKIVHTGGNTVIDGGTQAAPVEFLNEGIVLEGGNWRSWSAGENWIKGQIKLAATKFRFDAPTAEKNMTFCLEGKFLSSETSSAWVRYQEDLWKNADGSLKKNGSGAVYYNGLVTLDLRHADCSEFYGKLATESGGVIRVGSSMPNAKVVLGELYNNSSVVTFPSLFPTDQTVNGSFQAVPSDGNASGVIEVGTLEENGGSIVLSANAKLKCKNLTLNGGAIEVGAASDGLSFGSLEVTDSLTVANSPVKIVLGQEIDLGGTVLTVAKTAGTLELKDFVLTCADTTRALLVAFGTKLVVEDAGTCWKLNLDMMPVVKKTKGDNNSTKASFMTNVEFWTDHQYPHPGVTYYSRGYMLYPLNSDYTRTNGVKCTGGLFTGERLVFDGTQMYCDGIATARGFDFPGDGVFIADSATDSLFRFWGTARLSGTLTVLATRPKGFRFDWAVAKPRDLEVDMKLVSPENAYLDLTFQGSLFGKPDTAADGQKYYDQLITVRLNGDVSEWRGTIGVETNHLLVTKNGLPNGTVAMGLTGFPYDQLGSFENGNNGTLSVTNDGAVAFGGLQLNGGRLELAAEAVCTVGDLSLRKGVIQCAATRESAGRIVVTNAVTVAASPVKIRLSSLPRTSVDLLTAPKASTFAATDFAVADTAGNALPSAKYAVELVEEGASRILRLVFNKPGLTVIVK